MSAAEITLLLCLLLVVYPYLLYPLLLALIGKLRGRPVRRVGPTPHQVSILLCVHNEAASIEQRICDLEHLLDQSAIEGELIIVSDGSTDATANLVRLHESTRVHLIELPHRLGKAAALNRATRLAQYPILVLCDVRQRWADDALVRLLENFADPEVGAVSGDLVIETAPGTLLGVGLYWKYEKWIRKQESRVWAQIGVTGAIAAVRRELYRPIPPGTLLDDVYWPLRVAMAGFRVVHDERAIAYDRLPARTQDEFHRKVRTLAGNLQLAVRLPWALIPIVNPVWIQLLSHKLLRLTVPWALLGMLVSNLMLWDHLGYRILFLVQVTGYTLGILGLIIPGAGRSASLASSFLVLNSAAWMAWWVWLTGRAGRTWHKVRYERPTVTQTTQSV
jgi:cellulose synthase/poly-beta-1,6-N-acetylglucosamine synthase-like glycosyltransferase